jgi:hypothetical protein
MKPGKDTPSSKIRLRKHLTADALVRAVRREFEKIPDPRKGRPQISFADAAMSAFAMFSLARFSTRFRFMRSDPPSAISSRGFSAARPWLR